MSKKFTLYNGLKYAYLMEGKDKETVLFNNGENRQLAVEAALRIIEASVLGGDKSSLDYHFKSLSKYADNIQEALGDTPNTNK